VSDGVGVGKTAGFNWVKAVGIPVGASEMVGEKMNGEGRWDCGFEGPIEKADGIDGAAEGTSGSCNNDGVADGLSVRVSVAVGANEKCGKGASDGIGVGKSVGS
jgi:hypothetical protein